MLNDITSYAHFAYFSILPLVDTGSSHLLAIVHNAAKNTGTQQLLKFTPFSSVSSPS